MTDTEQLINKIERLELNAKRFRETPGQKRKRERQAIKNKRYKKRPKEITQQPKKQRGAFVGRVSFEWINGPKKGNKYSVMVTLQYPARLKIRGKELWVYPKDKDIEPFIWGGAKKAEDAMSKDGKRTQEEIEGTRRLRHPLRIKYEEMIKEFGPAKAGQLMAKGFVRAYNKIETKRAKRALAKLYGSVVRTNTVGHESFARQIRRSASIKTSKEH